MQGIKTPVAALAALNGLRYSLGAMSEAIGALALMVLLALFLQAADDPLTRGIALFNQGRYASALAELRNAGSGTTARVYIALTHAAMNDCASALPTLNEQSKHIETDLGRLAALAAAKCDASANKPAEAEALLESLKARYPNDPDVLYLAAETEMKAFNQTTFEMFERMPQSYRVHQLSGEILEVQNRYSDAVAEYRKAIDLNPRVPDLHYRLGRAILLADHSAPALAQAAAAFQAELEISPEDSASEFQLGQIAQVQGRPADAQHRFEQALKLSPHFETAMIALGRLYVQQKDYGRAIPLLKQATDLQPQNETAHYVLMTAYRDAGQRDKAVQEKAVLDQLQKPPDGEFSRFLQKLGEQPQHQ